MGATNIGVVGRLHGSYGVELAGLDVARCNQADVLLVRGLLAEHGLLLIRGQTPNDSELVDFARLLGTGELELPARSVTRSEMAPEVANLTNLRAPDGHPLGYGGNAEDYWHSDQEFRLRPATLGMLYCLIPSRNGGRTTFASTRIEDLALDPAVLGELERASFARRPSNDHDNTPQVVVSHRALLARPGDGRRSAYVTEHSHRYLRGGSMTKDDPLIRRVLDAILRDSNRYSHEWRCGDLLVFDNTQLIHRREAFSGLRFLKSLKVFAPADMFCLPSGEVLRDVKEDDR